MTKIVYNACYGGFSLSEEGVELYKKLSGLDRVSSWDIDRTDPVLLKVLETLGEKASGTFSLLKIREIPEGTKYRIDEYDGYEAVMTIDDYYWKVA